VTDYHAEHALIGDHVASDVRITVADGTITDVVSGVPATGATHLAGIVLPGLVNAHSHAFHRALRGRSSALGDFWEWRRLMYRVAAHLDPDGYQHLATLVYAEMALAGITTVGEFHYLHHPPTGRYRDPNAMGEALLRAAGAAGIRITLLDTCYLRAGFDRPAEGVQARFDDGSADGWIDRVERLAGRSNTARIGAAIHSVRAVDVSSAGTVAAWARTRGLPLHFHLSEQPAENTACVEATGKTPTALLAGVGALAGATAVHAIHLSPDDIAALGEHGAAVCACPTTERDLGDGIAPIPELLAAGCSLAVGSDSQAVIDLIEETRLVELHERLRSGRRGAIPVSVLLAAAGRSGAAALGWDTGVIEPGRPADFIAVALDSTRTAGITDPRSAFIDAATAADVTDVVVAGVVLVADGAHRAIDDPGRRLDRAIRGLVDW
jgi:formiminoglutamate deiminase